MAACLAALEAPALAAPSDTLWRYTAPAKIRGMRVDAAGNLVIATDTLVVALNQDSGAAVWTYRVSGEPSVFRTVLDSYFLVGCGPTAAALDPVTGSVVWRRTDLPDLELSSFGTSRQDPYAVLQTRDDFAVLDMRTGATMWNSGALPQGTVVREYFRLSDSDLLLLIARTDASDVSAFGATLDSGRVLWRNDALFKAKPQFKRAGSVEYLASGVQYSTLFPDSTLFLYVSADGPMRMDPRTGAVRWQAAELAGAPVPGWDEGFPTARMLDSLVLVCSDRRLVALDAATGRVRWRTTRDFRDQPTWLRADSIGILVGGLGRNKSFLCALEPLTGQPAWPNPIELKASAIGLAKRDTVYLSDDSRFTAIARATGTPRLLTTIDFQGAEEPTRIDTLEGGGFILSSRQNIARVDDDGRVAYRRFYKAPGASFWEKLATSALLLGANVASYSLTPAGGWAPMFVSNPVLSARYGQISRAQDFFYIFTASPDSVGQEGFSLVLLDRRDGRELGRMWFAERSPDYTLDPVTGSVYVLEDDTRIVSRRFRL